MFERHAHRRLIQSYPIESIYPSIHPSIYLSIYLCIYLSTYLSIHLSIYLYLLLVKGRKSGVAPHPAKGRGIEGGAEWKRGEKEGERAGGVRIHI